MNNSQDRRSRRRNILRGLLSIMTAGIPVNYAGTVKIKGRKVRVFRKPNESVKQARLRFAQENGIDVKAFETEGKQKG